MSATLSNSSNVSQTQTQAGPSPYGTRSRHRPSNSRPNYAEDIEMDFEVPIAPAENDATRTSMSRKISIASEGKASNKASEQANGVSVRSSTRRSVGEKWHSPPLSPASKASDIPGTSSFSAAAPASGTSQPSTNSKKRKSLHGHEKGSTHGNGSSHPPSAAKAQAPAMTKSAGAMAAATHRETNMMTFEKSKAMLKKGKLEADSGVSLAINDHVYLVCEPPGDPYYLCRIMEFIHRDSDNPKSSPIESMRVNWYYRPRDVLRYNNDTRLVYGTMHSDVCPITSLRGKCKVLHRSEIEDLDEYRKSKDCFWFNQIFDRFIHRWYEVIPTSQIINVPEKVKKALDERWKYIVVETGRVKELTSAVKTCKRCSGYCPTNESVECAVCHSTYHMNCVRPPLLKKPSRGFAWACGPCSRAQERKLEAQHTALISDAAAIEAEEEEVLDEEEEDPGTTANTTAPSPSGSDHQRDQHQATQAEIALAKMWPMRYLGIHCRVEDALQYDDRAIYPRASSRLGPRHQATVNSWYGRPVEYVKPVEIKKKFAKHPTHKKDGKLTKETIAALEADRAEKAKRPKWVQDEPPGYVRRGEDADNSDPDCTARILFRMPEEGGEGTEIRHSTRSSVRDEESVDAYMERAKGLAKLIGVKPFNTNFLDMALKLLVDNNYDAEAALKQLRKVDKRKDLHEPELSKEELKRFEDGVAKNGSELRSVRMHVKTLSHADVVRFYYLWKKSPRGREIWGAYGGRKGTKRKAEADAAYRLVDDVADDYDDSAFDHYKAVQKKRGFQCKFCAAKKSRQWRRAPGVAPGQTVLADSKASSKDKNNQLLLALCQRCAILWRKYAIKWENIDELAKKAAQGGGKAWKKRLDEELMLELQAANDAAGPDDFDAMTGGAGTTGTGSTPATSEPARKKSKTMAGTASAVAANDKTNGPTPSNNDHPPHRKKEKPAPPPPPPKLPTPPPPPPPPPLPVTQPKLRQLPCAVCRSFQNPGGDQLFTCKHCRLAVHRDCYGIDDSRSSAKWLCDMCLNDRTPQVSMSYKCVLCPVFQRHHDLLEPLKQSKHKKTERERERDRTERELAQQFVKNYAQSQRDKGWPESPREALKKTANNNWVHVTCAVWTPEIRFSDASALEVAEGIARGSIAPQRFDLTCKYCKSTHGICISCPTCRDNFHIGCAHLAGCTFGFDITPVKSSRRDTVNIVTLGQEMGYMTAAVWCKDHQVKTVVHQITEMTELDEQQLNTLQLFARTYKQADLTHAGTERKANLVSQFMKSAAAAANGISTAHGSGAAASNGNALPNSTGTITRRASAATPTSAGPKGQRASCGGDDHGANGRVRTASPAKMVERRCYKCRIDVSPKWWKVEKPARPLERVQHGPTGMEAAPVTNGIALPYNGGNAKLTLPNTSMDGRNEDTVQMYQCHKCHWKQKNRVLDADEPASRAFQSSIQSPGLPQTSSSHPWPVSGPSSLPVQDQTSASRVFHHANMVNGVATGDVTNAGSGSSRSGSNMDELRDRSRTRPIPPQLPMHHNPLGPPLRSPSHPNGYQKQHQTQHSSVTPIARTSLASASSLVSPSSPAGPSLASQQAPSSVPRSPSTLSRPVYASRHPAPPSPSFHHQATKTARHAPHHHHPPPPLIDSRLTNVPVSFANGLPSSQEPPRRGSGSYAGQVSHQYSREDDYRRQPSQRPPSLEQGFHPFPRPPSGHKYQHQQHQHPQHQHQHQQAQHIQRPESSHSKPYLSQQSQARTHGYGHSQSQGHDHDRRQSQSQSNKHSQSQSQSQSQNQSQSQSQGQIYSSHGQEQGQQQQAQTHHARKSSSASSAQYGAGTGTGTGGTSTTATPTLASAALPGRPATPHEASASAMTRQGSGGAVPGSVGASASPSLKNLLH